MCQVLEQVQVEYIGVDVVPDLIRYNQQRFGNERINFSCLNAVTDPLPQADLIIIRQVLQHLSNKKIRRILERVKSYKYALITEHMLLGDEVIPNIDIYTSWRVRFSFFSSVFIDLPPFNIKNAKIFLEYPAIPGGDTESTLKKRYKSMLIKTVMRTYLIENGQ